jgi:nucleotide-binding universal stress UspA family protein
MRLFPTKILLATDGSEEAGLAATTAINLVRSTDSELHVLTVGPGYPAYDVRVPEVAEELRRQTREILDEQLKKIEQAGGGVAQAHLRLAEGHPGFERHPSDDVVRAAEEIGAGLIVLGSRGRGGLSRALLGSVSDSVVRHAHCPAMVVRTGPVAFPTQILLATDGSKDAEVAASIAADLAASTGSELHVVAVFPAAGYVHPYYEVRFPEAAEQLRREGMEEAQQVLDEQVERIRKMGVDVAEAHLRTGEPEKEIVALAEELGAGLIAMGSRGLGGIRRALMGGVSDSVVRHAHCPVLVVRRISRPGHAEDTARSLLRAMQDVHKERHPNQPLQEGTALHPRLAAERLDLSPEHPDYEDAMGWLEYSGALVPHDPAADLSVMDTHAITRRGLEILEEDT